MLGTPMEQVIKSCDNYEKYPQNLVGQNVSLHRIEAYRDRLQSEEDRLFDVKHATVDVLDVSEKYQDYRLRFVTSLEEVQELFDPKQTDLKRRFFFIHAQHSRARLRISRNMLNFLLSHYQVPPSFLDYIFPFGEQEYAQDYYFSGLRKENRLYMKQRGPKIPEWGRSGCDIRICYNLRSVERSPKQTQLGWSVRQTAVYHWFDIVTGQTLWINVKGNQLLKNRVLEAADSSDDPSAASTASSFSASLETHLLFAEWAGENWRWYINELETELQKLTRMAVTAPIHWPHGPIASRSEQSLRRQRYAGRSEMLPQTSTNEPHRILVLPSQHRYDSRSPDLVVGDSSGRPEKDALDGQGWRRSNLLQRLLKSFGLSRFSRAPLKSQYPVTRAFEVNNSSRRMQPPELPPEIEMTATGAPSSFNEVNQDELLGSFSFKDLQCIQHIEEKIEEANMVLSFNADTLKDLRQFYHSIIENPLFGVGELSKSREDMMIFESQVEATEKELAMHGIRVKTLLNLVQERKALLNSILQYRSMKASEFFAKKAQESTDSMETITVQMHQIAIKTEQETVSMRIITLVTLFFLPGTFVATFMSTDILRFTEAQRVFKPEALTTYLAISLPMMAVTFMAWFLFYKFARYKENYKGGVMAGPVHNDFV